MKYAVNFFLLLLTFASNNISQLLSPIEKNYFMRFSEYYEIENFIKEANKFPLIETKILTVDSQGKNVYAVFISVDSFKAPKPYVFIIAQQHGNEHSGKEAALYLISSIINKKHREILAKLNIIVIPQLNPTGSDNDKRRNADGIDLNRDHLILSANETKALLGLYFEYLPIATLDVHEYYPYSQKWKNFGGYKAWDILFGTLTNPNVYKEIIDLQQKDFLPKAIDYVNSKGFLAGEYVVGGPPDQERIRRSTLDINDGRQSLGILGCFSMILEGRNGRTSNENLKRRTLSQYEAIIFFLKYVAENLDQINSLVTRARYENMRNSKEREVFLRFEHMPEGKEFKLILSDDDNNLKEIATKNYHSLISKKYSLKMPAGYLIPKEDINLMRFIKDAKIFFYDAIVFSNLKVEEYAIKNLKIEKLEELDIVTPEITISKKEIKNAEKFVFIPTEQMSSVKIAIALEPLSMFGISQYPEYSYLLRCKFYPIMRVMEYSLKKK